MFKNKKMRAVTLAGAALCVAATTALGSAAVAAIAAPSRVNAPYAQASALIAADGSIIRGKGIKSVTKAPALGRFCVQFEDSRLDVTEITPVATLSTGGYPGSIYIDPGVNSQCNNQKDTLLIVTTDENRAGQYREFFLLVP
ncbi:hypothetical protein [Streptosporangium sp. NPDC001681]|uniref:hypothetical protein n=1 Tax=Streptosporangium sp. NPDC001681 TaxID=3154395 RepID=UPI0033319C9F